MLKLRRYWPRKNPIEPPSFEENEHGDTFLVHNKGYVILDLQWKRFPYYNPDGTPEAKVDKYV